MSLDRHVVLLGPQRLKPTLAPALASLGIEGPLAIVTAGWEERESEDRELREHVGLEVRNLAIFERCEDLFRRDPELFAGMRERHDRMRKVQELYRVRLAHALEAAREMLRRSEMDLDLIEPEREGAIENVRQIDTQHFQRVGELHAEFDERWKPAERQHVARHQQELARELSGVGALLIAGGHVAILLNRMRLFDVLALHGPAPIVGWGAGAMVLGDRIVLFHDNPPQGPGNAEVLEVGLGVCPGVVPLPHARRRLHLEDPTRVGLFARRFGPSLCVALDQDARVDWDGRTLTTAAGTETLTLAGTVVEGEAA
jgi:hypothetical protein